MKLMLKLCCLLQSIILIHANPAEIDVNPELARQLTFALSKGLNQFNHDLFPKLAAENNGNDIK